MKRQNRQKNLMLTRSYARLGWIVLGVGLLACSCAKEQDEIISTGDDDASLIVPEALVGDVVETETKADLSGLVIGTSFPANYTKVFSVVGYKGTTAPTTNWSSPYIANIAVYSGSNGTLSFATPQYYPVDGQKVYFYAYSPVKGATYTAGSGSTAPKVTWTLDGHTDVMAAQVTTGIAKAATGTQSQPAFAFTHKLMQLKFKVMKDAALTDLGNVTALKVNNAATSLSMTLSNGNVTTLSTGSLTAYSSTTGQAVTTTAAYLGTNGSPCLTTKTDNLTLTLTCGSKTYTVTPDLPTDAGPGKICEITLKIIPDGLVITSITLNSSSSVTIPRAGGTFTLVAQTQTSPTSNISWLVKDANDNEVGRSTSYAAYNKATVTVDENKAWETRSLTLYWSYQGSEPQQCAQEYTLNQTGGTITSCKLTTGNYANQSLETACYAGVRTLVINGDYATGQQFYLTNGSDKLGPFTMSASGAYITLKRNVIEDKWWSISPIREYHTAPGWTDKFIIQRKATITNISDGFICLNGTYAYLDVSEVTYETGNALCTSDYGHLVENMTAADWDALELYYGDLSQVRAWLTPSETTPYRYSMRQYKNCSTFGTSESGRKYRTYCVPNI